MQKLGIHWFRRDLRLRGNQALIENLKRSDGRVLGLFCFDSRFLSRPDFSHNRFAFFLETLNDLREEMHRNGGDLLVVDEIPEKSISTLHKFFQKNSQNLSVLSWARDYEPFARERDSRMKILASELGIKILTERDHLLLEPSEVLKDSGGWYKVFTPFYKKWCSLLQEPSVQKRLRESNTWPSKSFVVRWDDFSGLPFQDSLDRFTRDNRSHITIPIPAAGPFAAGKHLQSFQKIIKKYGKDRDFPSTRGTSKLSVFFKNGSLVNAQVIWKLKLHQTRSLTSGHEVFLKELVWREFYYHLLFHCPQVEHTAFQEKYKSLAWKNRDDWFKRWCEGKTGFPIVDAGMRELNSTGWMHNRVRMIVASFLTKDLLIDWRWGEKYFMHKLLDGDLACNNGGWQWAASTGCDPQPYFRIFNPWLQSEKFDPLGKYIKNFVPELANAPAKALHNPLKLARFLDAHAGDYPVPIVDHSIQRMLALNLFTNVD